MSTFAVKFRRNNGFPAQRPCNTGIEREYAAA